MIVFIELHTIWHVRDRRRLLKKAVGVVVGCRWVRRERRNLFCQCGLSHHSSNSRGSSRVGTMTGCTRWVWAQPGRLKRADSSSGNGLQKVSYRSHQNKAHVTTYSDLRVGTKLGCHLGTAGWGGQVAVETNIGVGVAVALGVLRCGSSCREGGQQA
jgi:hypothetical protein